MGFRRFEVPNKKLNAVQVSRTRSREMFRRFIGGRTLQEISKEFSAPPDEIRRLIRMHVKVQWVCARKWKLAEVKCRALSMELRLLRMGKEAPEDKPIQSLEPPKRWLAAFLSADIDTVNKLRSVDTDLLRANWRFPNHAIDWACMKLNSLGLSHRLTRHFDARGKRLDKLPYELWNKV